MLRFPSLKRRFFAGKPGVVVLSPPTTPPRTPSPEPPRAPSPHPPRSPSRRGVYARSDADVPQSPTPSEAGLPPLSPQVVWRQVETIVEGDEEGENTTEGETRADGSGHDGENESGNNDADDAHDDGNASEWSFGNTAPDASSSTADGILATPAFVWRAAAAPTDAASQIPTVPHGPLPPGSDASTYEDAVEQQQPQRAQLVFSPALGSPPDPSVPVLLGQVPRRASSLRAPTPPAPRPPSPSSPRHPLPSSAHPPSPSSTRATHRQVVPARQRRLLQTPHARPSVLRRLATRGAGAPPVPEVLWVAAEPRRTRRKPVPYASVDEHGVLTADAVRDALAQEATDADEDVHARLLAVCKDEGPSLVSLLAKLDAIVPLPARPLPLADVAVPDADEAFLRARFRARLELGHAAPPTLAAYRALATAEAEHAAQVAWFVEERACLKRALDGSFASWQAERDLHLRTLLREMRLRRKVHALEVAQMEAKEPGEPPAVDNGEDDDEDPEVPQEPLGIPLQDAVEAADRANASIAQLVEWVDRLKAENRGLRARLAGKTGEDYNWPTE